MPADVEVRPDRLAGLADAVRLVGLEAVQGEAVFVRVDGDGADAEFVGRAEDADGDLAAVGDEQLPKLDGAGTGSGIGASEEGSRYPIGGRAVCSGTAAAVRSVIEVAAKLRSRLT